MFLNVIETPTEKRWLETCYTCYSSLCRVAARYFSKTDTENQDVVQNVYVKLARRPGYFRRKLDPLRFKGYLVVMTRHEAVDVLRRRARLSNLLPLEEEVLAAVPLVHLNVPDMAAQFADIQWVDQAAEQMPEPELHALVLTHVMGLTCRQAAKVMDANYFTTRSRVRNGTARMKGLLMEALT